ncbi:MAG: DNA-binding NarL/FixJ family response regulator [Psychrobacter glaciei]|jgi:DNA-binding NarL/FixJ family response regulator
MKKIKILIVDDHPIFSFGLGQILQSIFFEPNILYCSSVISAQAITDENLDLDWIFLDLNLTDTNGIALVHYCHSQKYLCPIVIISASDDANILTKCIEDGVNGIMSKNASAITIEFCLNQIRQKSFYIQPSIQTIISSQSSDHLIPLSNRQKEVLLLISEGYTNKEISNILNIAIGTVKKHVSLVMQLFSADNRTHCTAEAKRQGIIF